MGQSLPQRFNALDSRLSNHVLQASNRVRATQLRRVAELGLALLVTADVGLVAHCLLLRGAVVFLKHPDTMGACRFWWLSYTLI